MGLQEESLLYINAQRSETAWKLEESVRNLVLSNYKRAL